MAVKFSQFDEATIAANVTKLVGYTAGTDINVQIPPANLDTLVTTTTAQPGGAGTDVTYTLTGTKTGTASTTDVTTYTVPANSGMAMTAATNTIDFDATAYSLAATDTSPAGTVPLILTGAGGGDAGTDTVNLVGAGSVQLTASGNTITIDGFAAGDVASFTNDNTGTYVAYGTVNTAQTGAVTIGDVDLTAVNGTADSATRFLSKDNTWDVPAYPAGYTGWTVSDGSNSTAVANGDTVTFTGGTGITSTESSGTVTLAIDYAGADNAILAATAATVAVGDTIWFSDADDSDIKKGLVSDLPFNETLDEVTTAGNTTANIINVGGGNAAGPGYGINGDASTGVFSTGAGILGLATGGAAALTIDATQNGTFNSLGAVTLPAGTTANRNDVAIIPSAVNGMIRYNSTDNSFEGYINSAWGAIGGSTTRTKQAHIIAGTTIQNIVLSIAPSPNTTAYVDLYISGVYQAAASYTISGTTLALVQSPGAVYFPQGAVVETIVQS